MVILSCLTTQEKVYFIKCTQENTAVTPESHPTADAADWLFILSLAQWGRTVCIHNMLMDKLQGGRERELC